MMRRSSLVFVRVCKLAVALLQYADSSRSTCLQRLPSHILVSFLVGWSLLARVLRWPVGEAAGILVIVVMTLFH